MPLHAIPEHRPPPPPPAPCPRPVLFVPCAWCTAFHGHAVVPLCAHASPPPSYVCTVWSLLCQARVQIVNGTMVSVQRASKAIGLADGSVVPYDVLVLTAGLAEPTVRERDCAISHKTCPRSPCVHLS